MLRPQDGPTRERRSLSGLWRFRLDAEGAGRTDEWWRSPLEKAVDMPVPASYNDIYPDETIRDHVGDAWYQTEVRVPASWAEQRVVLRFDAATHRAAVWVNDVQVVEHTGGYTPFEADVTAQLRPGAANRVTVVVNNELSWSSIPPGRIEDQPDGRRVQRYFHDFFNYAGLHRPVWLYTTPTTYISDISVATTFDGTTGVIDYRVEVDGPLRVVLRDASGNEVAAAAGAVGTLRIPDVHPWAPGDGYLYELEATIPGERGDSYRQPVGVRTVEVRGQQFLINGKPFYFKGFGKHEDAAVRGKGYDDALMVHDFALLDWIGANSFRTSHYPYAEEVLDYADRHGVVVIGETPAVGLNLNLGGGIFNSGKRPTFSPDTVSDDTQQAHLQAIRELVARDKNRPSVALWCLVNEPDNIQPEARDYFRPLAAEARHLDPTRPIGYANALMGPPAECMITDLFDVVLLNRYYGWYVGTGDLRTAETALEDELRQWAGLHDKPIVITEYGADTYPGLRATLPSPWTEEFQVELLDVYHRVFDRVDAVVGEHVWNFADFATSPGVFRVDGNKKGVFTRDRRPKTAAFRLRDRWHS
ncbi:beta-glucuronidase [Kribbella albertanoniae]|uniref:Beta-glucuronidase n=1 Tax=Kribbella albertanoniae TaxID=1266829 RepID=A0A4R4P572_9ACTN|nr:beta-glucuronidase [Kribbella albertanoniae]TDC17215.1 beta-glucuronidase [Kribbella albertanoniae]